MENLQLVLFALGAIAIIAVLVHGFWSIRKQQPKSLKESPMSGFYKNQASARDSQGFDSDGIGEVRVKKSAMEDDEVADNTQADTQQFSVKTDTVDDEQEFTLSDASVQRSSRQRTEPVISAKSQDDDVQMELGLGQNSQSSLFDTVETEVVAEPVPEPEVKVEEAKPLGDPKDVLVLHVVANEGEELNGAELLPCLLSLNFKFGDMDIFHRHEDNAGNGKVLFSLANMVKPGIFNLDDMEQFTTEGVVLFMTLPCHGDPLMNFSIMLNSAHQLADDVGGRLLDGGRAEWNESTKQVYLQRIRAQLD
jgi:cell division protein ZipA